MESYAAHVHSWYLRARTRARTIPRGVTMRRGACTIYSKRTFQCTRDSRNFCWCSSILSFTLKCHILPPATDLRRLGANPFKPVVATSATLFLAASGTGGVVCSGGSGTAAATTCDCSTSPMAPYPMWPITCGQKSFGPSVRQRCCCFPESGLGLRASRHSAATLARLHSRTFQVTMYA